VKILVTGAAGYIGATLTAHLLSAGMDVVALDKLVYGGEAILSFFSHPRFRLVQGDVRDGALLRKVMRGVDGTVHLAAVVGEAACSIDEEAAWSINYGGTQQVLSAARECGTKYFIFVSTCSNYGVSMPNVVADEESPLKPLSQYAKSKVEAERAVLQDASRTCVCVLRFGTICGLSSRMRFDLLISEMARAAALGESVRIFAPEAWRPFLHVRDAARVIGHCLGRSPEELRGKVYNVVGENLQKTGLIALVLKHYPKVTIEITDKQPDLRDYRVSGERIKNEIGFRAGHTVEEAFLETSAAVSSGVFRDPHWSGHSAVPDNALRLR
jgi:nucleoside-diphosphate-sugar epimerase